MKCTLLTVSTVVAFALFSCKRVESGRVAEPGSPPQTFAVQGILRGIDFAGRSVTVEHEDIAGFMPAMTMPFDVKTMAEVEPLKAGDAIEFQLIVNAKASWIEGVKKIDPRAIQLPERKVTESDPTAKVARLKEGNVLPEFQLVDSKGRQVTRATFAGKPLLITFIFTRCPIPNFCPLMTNNFREIQQALAETPDHAASVQLLSISVDSEFDTPEVLAQYAARHTKDTDQWRFATGAAAETTRLTQAFSLTVQPESGTISHGLATALVSAEEIETSYLTILTSVIGQVRIPVAVKLSPFFTNLSQFAKRLVQSGAGGLVLFNRFYQPDIELETREVIPRVVLSTPSAMRLPLRWIAILRGRIGASLAASGGIHRATDALKMLMAGADVTMLCSMLLTRGIGHLGTMEQELQDWMEEHEVESIEQLKGCLSQEKYADPSAYERAQYLRAVSTARTAD